MRHRVITSRYRTWCLRNWESSASICRWMSVTDQELSHIHAFSAKVLVILIDEWPDDFRKVGIKTLTLSSRVMEGWIFYVSGLAIILMSVGMTVRRMTGCHRSTGIQAISQDWKVGGPLHRECGFSKRAFRPKVRAARRTCKMYKVSCDGKNFIIYYIKIHY